MTAQQNPVTYARAIQAALTTIVTPVPVYATFNRNFATEPKFITWICETSTSLSTPAVINLSKALIRRYSKSVFLLK